jgi:PAS domain S-box-containing protein
LSNAWALTTPFPVVVTDGEGRLLVVNDAFEQLFAISQTQLPSEPIEDLIIASRFRSAYRDARRTALTGGRAPLPGSVTEFVAVRADGGEFAVNLSVARTNEHPVYVVTWIRDLTQDRALVAQTLRRAVLFERAEELAGFGSWDWTPETERLRWSDNMFRIYGLRPGEIVPSPEYVFARCHPDDRKRVEEAAFALSRAGQLPELRYRYVRPDGTVRHLTSTVVSVAKSGGLSQRIIGTVQDLTEQHQAERELAARFAVSAALSDWEPGGPGARRLVRDLAEALEFEVGVLLVPRGDVLVPSVVWQARALHAPALESALREVRLERAEGLAGSAWVSAQPARVANLTDKAAEAVRLIDAQTGMHGSLAVPATYGQEVVAVLTFASHRKAVLTDRFMRSLLGIGYEIGHFLARRRGELSAPPLTPRELEVLQLSATGHARRQIAEVIEVSEATVKTHFEHIYRKLGVSDRASAVGEALRQGLIN